MDRNNSKDNLEDLFGSFFNDSTKVNKKEGWNVPSEEVWDKIQEGLIEEEKPRRRFIYWHWVAAAASFLLLFSMLHWYNSYQKINDLSIQLATNDQLIKDMQSDLNALNEKKVELTKRSTPKQKETFKETTVFNRVNASQNPFKPNIIPPASSNKKLEEVVVNDSSNKITSPLLLAENVDKGLTKQEQKENILINVSQIPVLPRYLAIKKRKLEGLSIPIISPVKKKASWYIGVNYAPMWTTIKNKGFQFERPEFFAERETQETAYTAGLQIGRSLGNNWYLESGLRYSSVNNSIQHNRTIPYQFLQERLNTNGEYESNLNLQLSSTGGAVETEVLLSRSASNMIAVEEDLQINFSFSNSLAYLDVPMLLKKEWNIGRIGIIAKTGLLNRFLIQSSFEIQDIALEDNRFKPISTQFRKRNNSAAANYSAYYFVGLGLEYSIQSNWSIYFEPTFTQSIKPTVDFGRASIYTQNKMVNVGLKYTL